MDRTVKMDCPACSATVHRRLGPQVYECTRCDAIHGTLYRGDYYSGRFINPTWDPRPRVERTRYFDFMVLGSEGVKRVHGWIAADTRQIVQVG
jgi:hypothetical protein